VVGGPGGWRVGIVGIVTSSIANWSTITVGPVTMNNAGNAIAYMLCTAASPLASRSNVMPAPYYGTSNDPDSLQCATSSPPTERGPRGSPILIRRSEPPKGCRSHVQGRAPACMRLYCTSCRRVPLSPDGNGHSVRVPTRNAMKCNELDENPS